MQYGYVVVVKDAMAVALGFLYSGSSLRWWTFSFFWRLERMFYWFEMVFDAILEVRDGML